MKKTQYLLAVILLGLFSSVSLASIETYWATGTTHKAKFKPHKYVDKKGHTKNISINYALDKTNWTINSASLWVRAVDDFRGRKCLRASCADIKSKGRDGKEKIRIVNIEGQKSRWAATPVNRDGWYELLDVTTFLMNDTNNNFRAKLKSNFSGDFWFRNAKLVIDYDIKTDSAPTAPIGTPPISETPSEVPIPSAIWLFGSAVFGLFGLKRKPSFLA